MPTPPPNGPCRGGTQANSQLRQLLSVQIYRPIGHWECPPPSHSQLMALRFSAHLLSTRFLFTLNSRVLLSIPKLPALFMALSCFRSSSRVVGKLSSWRRRAWVRAWARVWGASAVGRENGHQDGRQSARSYLLFADSGQNSIGPLRQIEVVALRHPPGAHRGKLRIGRGHHPDRADCLVDETVRRCGSVANRVDEAGHLVVCDGVWWR